MDESENRVTFWPFMVADAVLILIAILVALLAPKPLSGAALFTVLGLCALALTAFSVPFVVQQVGTLYFRAQEADVRATNYARQLQGLRDELERWVEVNRDSANRLISAAEAAGKHPERIDADILQLDELLQREREAGERTAEMRNRQYERLESIVDGFDGGGSGSGEDALRVLVVRLDRIEQALQRLGDPPAGETGAAPEPAAAESPVVDSGDEPVSGQTAEPAEVPDATAAGNDEDSAETGGSEEPDDADKAPVEEATPKKKRRRRTARAVAGEPEKESPASAAAVEEKESPVAVEDKEDSTAAVAVAEDRQTSLFDAAPAPGEQRNTEGAAGTVELVVHAVLPIGHRPYLRGVGGGLSPDEGTVMEFAEIGRWRWSAEVDEEVELTVWRDDSDPDTGPPVMIEPGRRVEISPVFA